MTVAAARTLSGPCRLNVFAQIHARHIRSPRRTNFSIFDRIVSLHQIFVIQPRLGERISCMKLAIGIGRGFGGRKHFHRHYAAHNICSALKNISHAAVADRLQDVVLS